MNLKSFKIAQNTISEAKLPQLTFLEGGGGGGGGGQTKCILLLRVRK